MSFFISLENSTGKFFKIFVDMIRISVGIEDIEDLKADFAQAIEKMK